MKTLLSNCLIINEGKTFAGHLLIEDDLIAEVAEGDAPSHRYGADQVIDLEGAWVMPGAIDTHVHFRDPGLTEKGDMATESCAAVAGGVTSVIDMPNTVPQTTSVSAWQDKMSAAQGRSHANYAFYIGATNDNIEDLRQADYSRIPGIKLFMGSSTGGMLVDDERVLDEIFSLGRIVSLHSEQEDIIKENLAHYKKEAPGGDISLHPLIRSERACVECTRRALGIAERTGGRLHILHLSTAAELEMIRESKADVTSEVCASYLYFTDGDYAAKGAKIKCNPSIKSERDREALRRAVREGKVMCISTDHAPHLWSQKEGNVYKSASGMPGVQHSLPLMLTLAREGHWTRERVVELMAHRPAQFFGIERRGFLRKDFYADIAVMRPTTPYAVKKEDLLYKCGWSPLEGESLTVQPVMTFVNGVRAESSDNPNGRPLLFNIDKVG